MNEAPAHMDKSIPPVLALEGIKRSYRQGSGQLDILKDLSLSVSSGEIVALVAPSGAGKSTLLHLAGLLDRPDGGRVLIQGADAGVLTDRDRSRLRGTTIGFVYQFHHLLPEFSALENVILPQMILGVPRPTAAQRAQHLLGLVGLSNRASHRPAQLSGGEQQRTAIARALANEPKLLVADEPTGNLDQRTANEVFSLLLQVVRNQGVAALVATHNTQMAECMDRTLELHNGKLVIPALTSSR